MTSTQSSAPGVRDADGGPGAGTSTPGFRIRYGRLALALLGLFCLLTGVVSGVLRLFGVGSGWFPVLTLLAAVAAVVSLRSLAVRDRRRRVSAAFRAAMGAPAAEASPAGAATDVVPDAVPAKESPLFDAQAGTEAPRPLPLTVDQLRQAAMAEAAASGDTSVRRVDDPAGTEGSSWEPVEVPKPSYVAAPKAERAAPEPLDLPEAPKAAGKPSLKQGAARQPEAPAAEPKPLGKGQSALSNLDDVLQRRRA